MRLRRRLVTLTVVVLAVASLAGGGSLGARLGREASAAVVRQVGITNPEAFAGPAQDARRSPGGFTGFGGKPALAGDVLRSGTIEVNGASLAIVTQDGSLALRPTSPERLYSIVEASSAPRAGDVVQIAVKDGTATGVLKLPPGLGEGGNR